MQSEINMGEMDEVDNAERVESSDTNMVGSNEDQRKGTKRSGDGVDYEPILKRIRKNGLSASAQTPLALLNEIRTGLNYTIEQPDGPPHSPNFFATVVVDGIEFHGSGNAKKIAKQRAAHAALLTLCPRILQATNNISEHYDFTQDAPVTPVTPSNDTKGPEQLIQPEVVLLMLKEAEAVLMLKEEYLNRQAFGQKMARLEFLVNKAMSGGMNAVMALNEIFPGLKYECIQENSQKSFSPFVYSVTINNEVFKGSGTSKKAAKSAAARAVLLRKYEHLLNNSSAMMTPPNSQEMQSIGAFQAVAANQIAELVVNEYHKLMKGMYAEYSRRKVLAAIVMTNSLDSSPEPSGRLISIGTGTKCISGEHISVRGAALNDSHAEIVSRRGLLRFLYNQLALHASPSTAKDSIFYYDSKDKCYKVKNEVKFHLYISTSPCGDARIFSPHDKEGLSEDLLDRHPNRQSRGQLRAKIESGEGTIPVSSFDVIQTWDGVMQGQRLLTMSCSDKLGKWNVVGIQGSLLSHFTEPIYLHSVIIGSLFHPTHLRRAMYSRIEDSLEGLPPPFRLNKIQMNTTTSPEARQTGKAPNHAVNWIAGESDVEVVNAITGKTLEGEASRLCKQKLLGKFYGLLSQGIRTKTNMTIKNAPQFYADIKNASTDYQEAKSKLLGAFQKAGLGIWKKKPIEQDQFSLEINL